MRKKYKKIIKSNALHYSKNSSRSFPGALLKTSLIPFGLLDRYLNEEGKILDLGCGEGMLSNSLARLFPKAEIRGIDLDAEKIQEAQACKLDNVTFQKAEAGEFAFEEADAVIFNDVLHHNSYKEQERLISHAADLLKNDGLLILKEVDSCDKKDKFMTTFLDKKLYPEDELNFRNKESWKAILEKYKFELLKIEVAKHLFIASRTVFIAKKIPKSIRYLEGKDNLSLVDFNDGKIKVFVTGASGFIGYHMAMYLIENGLNGSEVDLFLLARSPTRIDQVLREKATIIKGDLLSLKEFSDWELFKHIDYVFHFAAEVKLHGDKETLVRTNIEGTRCMIDIFKGKKLRRFIHASTISAVDRQPNDTCASPMNEDTPPNPLSVYGETKLEAERLIKDSGLPYSIIRIPWAFGSRMTSDTHVRNLLEKVMHRSLATRINFPGKVSMIAVEDLAKAFEIVASHPQALNEVFFVAGYPPIALGALFKKMATVIIGRPTTLFPIPNLVKLILRKIRRFLPLTIQSLNSDVLCVDDTKIRNLGFQPERDLENSIIQLSAWINQQYNPKKKTFVVTGAASGIGLELSRKLVAAGKNVLLIDKNKEKLVQTSNILNMPHLCLDLASSQDVGQLMNFLKNEKELYGLANCAGLGRKDALIDLTSEKIDELIAVNISAIVKLSKGALEVFYDKGRGVLVNISSSAALQPIPYHSVYAAGKSFISNLTSSICHENYINGNIQILNIIPSGTKTAFYSSAGIQIPQKEKLLSPEFVADKIARLIEKESPSGTYFIGNRGRIMSLMARVLPTGLNTKIWRYLITKKR